VSFRNTILAGETIVRQAMQSEGFQSGVQGWRLERTGNAELNDITVRGELESGNYVPGTTGWHLDNGGTAEFNSASVRGSLTVEDNEKIEILNIGGRPRFRMWNAAQNNFAEISEVDDVNPAFASFEMKTGIYESTHGPFNIRSILGMRGPFDARAFLGGIREDSGEPFGGSFQWSEDAALISSYDDDGLSRTTVSLAHGVAPAAGGFIRFVVRNNAGTQQTALRIDGNSNHGFLEVEGGDWTAITVNSGSGGAGDDAPRVKLLPDGMIKCHGVISGHAVVANTTIATLPIGFRPARRAIIPCSSAAARMAESYGLLVRPEVPG
jgi:hypothetical protein